MTAIDRYEDRNIQVWDYTLHNYFRRPATSWHKVADQAIRVMSLHVPSFITSSSKRAAFIYRVVPTIVMENQLNAHEHRAYVTRRPIEELTRAGDNVSWVFFFLSGLPSLSSRRRRGPLMLMIVVSSSSSP